MSASRIQVKILGRRFEFSRDVALENVALFREFFAAETTQQQRDEICSRIGCSHETAQQKLIGGGSDETLDVFSFVAPDKNDNNTSPLPTTSTPDYFGLIQVALRKGREPAFSWDEMNPNEQASVVWIVTTFKIEKFMEKFGKVTKSSTADENNNNGDDKDKKENEQLEGVLDKMADALAKAHIKIAEAQDAQREEARKKQEEERDRRRQERTRNQSDSDDDENVVLTGVGCFFCGIATHNDDVCKFNPKNFVKEQ